ncbi:MAG: hypothetical protein K5886_01555 [Lachnospiraceae bacterium]|nr:hypothetical protein [Lachnospiraceae bacterium]
MKKSQNKWSFLIKLTVIIYCLVPFMANPVAAEPEDFNVSMEDWVYGEEPNEPTVEPVGYTGEYTTAAKYKFENADDDTYTYDVPENVGNYIVRIDISDEEGNLLFQGFDDFSISPRDISQEDSETTIELTGEPLVYDGSEQTQEFTVKVLGITLTESTDYTVTGNTGTNADDYELTVTGTGNYSGSANKAFTINPIDQELSIVQTGTLTYNRDAQEPALDKAGNAKEAGVDVFIEYSTEESGTYTNEVPKFTNAGEHTVYYKASAENYTEATGSFTVTIAKKPITINWSDKTSWKYDGEEHGPVPVIEGYCSGDVLVPDVDHGEATDAGNYTATVNGMHSSGDTESWKNYELPTEGLTKDYEITRRSITLTSGSDEKTYPQNAESSKVTVTGDGFVQGEGVTYNVTGSQTKPGTSKNTFTYTLNEGTKEGNYTITKVEGDLTVNWWPDTDKDKHTLTITPDSKTFDYDGNEHSVSGYTTVFSDSRANSDFTVEGISAGTLTKTDVGEYKYTVTGTPVIKYSGEEGGEPEDVTAHFTIVTQEGFLKINPKNLSKATITLGNSLDYNGSDQTQTFTVELDGRTLIKNTDYTVTGDTAKDVGEYTLTVTGAGNYTGSTSKKYTINGQELTGISVSQKGTLAYNGDAQGFEVYESADQEGVTFTYAAKKDGTYGRLNRLSVNKAATYRVYYKASKPGYNTVTGSFKVIVNKAVLGAKWSTLTSYAYDTYSHFPNVTPTNVMNNDDVHFIVDGASSQIGEHTATITGLGGNDAKNYELPSSNRSMKFKIYEILKGSSSPSSENDPGNSDTSGNTNGNKNPSSGSGLGTGTNTNTTGGTSGTSTNGTNTTSGSSTSGGNTSSGGNGTKSNTSTASNSSGNKVSTANSTSGNKGNTTTSSGSNSTNPGSSNSTSRSTTFKPAATVSLGKAYGMSASGSDSYNGGMDNIENAKREVASFTRLADEEAALRTVLGDEEYDRLISEGIIPLIRLNVSELNPVPDKEKQLAEAGISMYNSSIPNLTPWDYLDLHLEINKDGVWENVDKLNGSVQIIFPIADSFSEYTDSHFVLHLHEGEASLLYDVDDQPDTCTINTDGFSTFIMMYQGNENAMPGSGDNTGADDDASGYDGQTYETEEYDEDDLYDTMSPDTGFDPDDSSGKTWVIVLILVLIAVAVGTGVTVVVLKNRNELKPKDYEIHR